MNFKSCSIATSALASAALLASTPSFALSYTASNSPAKEVSLAKEFSPGTRTASGTGANGLSWTAANRIIGQTPTSAVLPPSNTIGGGDPIYRPSANKSGVVALIMEYADGGRFICSGSVLSGGMSIATAAHCVSGGAGTANPIRTTAYFFAGDPDVRTPFQTSGVAIDVSRYYVHPEYTGEVIDQNDIAILRLASVAPVSAERYNLFTSNIAGLDFNVAGYGTRSTVGGASGNTAPAGARTGFLREGDNMFDYAWGNSALGGFFTDRDVNGEGFFGFADYEFSYVSDFDNGLDAQSQAFRICGAVGGGAACNQFIDNGLGAREVNIAGGDSGGPGFIDGKLASINSYGLTFGANFGDFGGGLNSGWGEFSGYVPVFIHTDFIRGAVPEPSTWALLIAGFGLTGAAMRRQRKAAVTA